MKRKKKTKTAILNEKLSEICRLLNKQKVYCESCGTTETLQWCHVLSQGAHPNMRWEPLNHMLLCYACHLGARGWHNEVLWWGKWFEKKWPGRYDKLTRMAASKTKLSTSDKEELLTKLKGEMSLDSVPEIW